MHFSKYVGSGNDFIFIDNRDLSFPSQDPQFIKKLCHRQCGIGADGVILLENSSIADFKMRIFNSDGFEAEMCGNGSRCFFKFIQECTSKKNSYSVETKASLIRLEQDHSNVKVSMINPFEIRWNLDLKLDENLVTLHCLNTGVPHAILFTPEIEESDLKNLAPKIRFHEAFSPKGTNVNFVTIMEKNEIMVRTYERGIEAETLSCGTGMTASAIAAAYLFNIPLPIDVKTKTGDTIQIDCTITNETIQEVTMSGPAHLVYKGELVAANLNNLRKS